MLPPKRIVIAIDGYSSCGKSSTAKLVAARLGYGYIDTGAMYRAVTKYFIDHYVEMTNPKKVDKALEEIHISFIHNPRTCKNETFLNGINVEEDIRQMDISEKVSEVSTIAAVRTAMVAQQQRMGKKRGVVMDGRDIGTRVFPDAEVKIFMTADVQIRAMRRQQELLSNNQLVGLDKIIENLNHRDRIDSTRTESPLRQAEDAVLIDTSYLTLEEQIDIVVNMSISAMLEISPALVL